MKNVILQKLKTFEDPEFKFDPTLHKYTYKGREYISATTFIQRFHKEFDTEFWANKKSEELGVPVEEIKKDWKDKNTYSNEVGTAIHNWIENYFNRIWQELPTNLDIIDRINKFNKIYATHLHKLTPIRFEIKTFSKIWTIAGTIDSLFMYNDSIIIFDWKTNKSWTTDNDKCFEKLLSPFEDYWKNHLNEYSMQLSLYKLILREVGIDVKAMYLCHIGPETDARIYKCHDFTDKLETYLNENGFCV